MKNIKESIEKIADDAKTLYCLESTRQYLEDKKNEQRLTQQYKGREIYELIQNIDDAGVNLREGKCEAYVKFDGEYLEVANSGQPFTIQTIQRLCQGGVSDKSGKYIGCKGIGFRSVLNWADEIYIYSGKEDNYISVKFSREHAKKQIDSLLNANNNASRHIQNQIDELNLHGYDSSYPIFRAPQYVDPIDKEYDTIIRLKVKEELKEHIVSDLSNIERYRYILLFLPTLMKIDFEVRDKKITYSKKILESGNVIELTLSIDGKSETNTFNYRSANKKLSRKLNGSEDVRLGIAIPKDSQASSNYKLHTFFPIMELTSPLPALMNATFCLTDNRNDLDLSSEDTKAANQEVFRMLLDLYIETVTEVAEKDRRLELLLPVNMPAHDMFTFYGSLGMLGLEKYYIEKCRNHPVFYTVDGNYKKHEDSPIILESIPDSFKGDSFSRLVKLSDHASSPLLNFCKCIAPQNKEQTERYLWQAINSVSQLWEDSERIQTFKWWHAQSDFKALPGLLKTIDEEFIIYSPESKEDKPCFLSDNNSPLAGIPSWAKVSVLHQKDQEELIKAFGEEIRERQNGPKEAHKRTLSRIIRKDLIDIQEQSSRQVVISPVNSSVDSFDKACEFVLWLWKIWNENPFDDTIKNKISFTVPIEGNDHKEASKVYFGEDYGNIFGEQLFKLIDGDFRKLHKIEFGEGHRIEDFLKAIGISKFPRLQKVVKNNVDQDRDSCEYKFQSLIQSKRPITEQINWLGTEFYSIENLEHILKKLDTSDIVSWLFTDEELMKSIENDIQPLDCCIKYQVKYKWHPWTYNEGWQLPSFVRYVFSNTPWVGINGKKYSPSQLLLISNEGVNNCLEDFACLSEYELEELARNICDKEDLRSLLITLGAKSSYLELDSNTFYGMLLKIPELKEGGYKVSREIYRTIIDNSSKLDGYRLLKAASDNQERFKKEGKVLVKKGSSCCFEHISNAFFSSSAVIKTDGKYPIDVPARRGKKEDFNELLFIKPYEISYLVVGVEDSPCNPDFKKEWDSFIPCIMAYRKGKKDEICNLTIDLIKEATIEFDGVRQEYSTPYTLLKKSSKHWLICVGREIDFTRLDKCRIADSLVQIFNVLFNFPSKEFLDKVPQLFIYTKEQREHLIEDDLGSVDEIKEAKEDILKSEEFNQKILKFFGIEESCDEWMSLRQVNWRNPSYEDYQIIIKMLLLYKKTLVDMNATLELSISIREHNEHVFEQMFNDEVIFVEIYSAIVSDKEKHCKLRDLLFKHEESKEKYIKKNSSTFEALDFDKEDTYEKCRQKCWEDISLVRPEKVSLTYDQIKDTYTSNIECLKSQLGYTDLTNDFTNDPHLDSRLFFKIDNEELVKILKKFKEDYKKDTEAINDEGQSSDYIGQIYGKIKIDSDLAPANLSYTDKAHKSGAVTEHTKLKKERRNKSQGNTAEYLVVLKLQERAFEEVNNYFKQQKYKIKWVSGAYKAIQKVESDKNEYDISETNDSLGYDMKLVSEDNTREMFIEVKSSSSNDCSFYMSANEKMTATEKGDSYRVFFVGNLDMQNPDSIPEIHIIGDIENSFEHRPVQYKMLFKGKPE